VANQIADNAVNKDGKINPVTMKPDSSGACNNPSVWLSKYSTVWSGTSQSGINDRASQYVGNCDKYTKNVHTGDTYKTLAIVGFSVAGAAAVGTVIYYFVDSGKSDESEQTATAHHVTVTPMYQPGFAGGLVGGTF
jgi:hypothetical protein